MIEKEITYFPLRESCDKNENTVPAFHIIIISFLLLASESEDYRFERFMLCISSQPSD